MKQKIKVYFCTASKFHYGEQYKRKTSLSRFISINLMINSFKEKENLMKYQFSIMKF